MEYIRSKLVVRFPTILRVGEAYFDVSPRHPETRDIQELQLEIARRLQEWLDREYPGDYGHPSWIRVRIKKAGHPEKVPEEFRGRLERKAEA